MCPLKPRGRPTFREWTHGEGEVHHLSQLLDFRGVQIPANKDRPADWTFTGASQNRP